MRVFIAAAALILVAGMPPRQDDVLQIKDSGTGDPVILVGKVLKVTEKVVEFEDNRRGKMTISVDSIEPYSLYRVKSARINKKSGPDHFKLGEWCINAGLYFTAIKEFESAKSFDKKLKTSDDRLRLSEGVEQWSVRKALRRMVRHELQHTKSMRRIVRLWREERARSGSG